jgi:hypothetical protein
MDLITFACSLLAGMAIGYGAARVASSKNKRPKQHEHRYRHWVHRRQSQTAILDRLYEVYIAHCEICGKPTSKRVRAS